MGSGRWSGESWKSYATSKSYATKSAKEIYTKSSIDPDLDPKGVKIRESRDSEDNPNSNALIVALDVSGSMDPVLESMAKRGLNDLVTNIYERKPISDPHVMCMAIGDVEMGDRAPLQVTQFEADLRIAEALEKIYLEMMGGGNMYESYALSWFFAAMHTSIDCFEKRGKKGYLFTVGDEKPTPYLTAGDIKTVTGDSPERDLKGSELLDMVSRTYDVYHLIVEEGYNFQRIPEKVRSEWIGLLGQRAIRLTDHTKMSEVITSTIQINEGFSKEEVIGSWDGDTSVVVANAIEGLTSPLSQSDGLVEY